MRGNKLKFGVKIGITLLSKHWERERERERERKRETDHPKPFLSSSYVSNS